MRKSVKVGIAAYILPVLVTLAGLVIFFYPDFFGKSLGLIAGIALIVYGASDLISAFKMKSAKAEKVTPAPETPAETPSEQIQAKEVEYEKVDEQ
jgi:hypothetical protein